MNPGFCFSFPGSSTMGPAGDWHRPARGTGQPAPSHSQVLTPAVKISWPWTFEIFMTYAGIWPTLRTTTWTEAFQPYQEGLTEVLWPMVGLLIYCISAFVVLVVRFTFVLQLKLLIPCFLHCCCCPCCWYFCMPFCFVIKLTFSWWCLFNNDIVVAKAVNEAVVLAARIIAAFPAVGTALDSC